MLHLSADVHHHFAAIAMAVTMHSHNVSSLLLLQEPHCFISLPIFNSQAAHIFTLRFRSIITLVANHPSRCTTVDPILSITMSSMEDLDARAATGETVVPGGTGGKSVQAQQNLADGRSRGGQARAEQLGHEGYVEMGKKGGSATSDKSGGEAAATALRDIDESKFTN